MTTDIHRRTRNPHQAATSSLDHSQPAFDPAKPNPQRNPILHDLCAQRLDFDSDSWRRHLREKQKRTAGALR
jgi:hypothetical protein